MPTHEAGIQVSCPGCGQVVMQHSMIPLVGDGGLGVRYLCPPCARELIHPASDPAGDPAGEPAAPAPQGATAPPA